MRRLQWHEARVVERGGARAADVGRELVEGKALGTGEPRHVWSGTEPRGSWLLCAIVVRRSVRWSAIHGAILHRREQQQLAFCAGVEGAARRLVPGREAVGLERNEWQAFFHRGAGDLLLAGADAGRDKHRAARGGVEEAGLFGGEGFGRNAARALDLKPVGAVEQKRVAVGGIGRPGERQGVDAREVVGVLANEREAARVVGDIAKEGFQLAAMGEYAVVVAGGEQVRRIRHIWRITERRFSGRRFTGQPPTEPIRLGTPDLKATNDLAQMATHARSNKEKTVEMVRHDNAGEKLNFGMAAGNLTPTGFDAFSERSLRDGTAFETAQNRSTALHFEGDHVDATLIVVVAEATLLHLDGQNVRRICHGCIIPNDCIAFKAA